MWSRGSGTGFLVVEPARSPGLTAALAALHALALAAAMAAPLGWAGRCLVAALVVLGLGEALRVHVLRRGRAAVRSARPVGPGDWALVLGDGRRCEARLAPGCLVLPWLVVLRFSLGRWRRRTLIVPADALAPDVHRRLRALLLREPAPGPRRAQSERGE